MGKGSPDKTPLGRIRRILRNPCHQLQTPLPELGRPLCLETGEDFAGDFFFFAEDFASLWEAGRGMRDGEAGAPFIDAEVARAVQ